MSEAKRPSIQVLTGKVENNPIDRASKVRIIGIICIPPSKNPDLKSDPTRKQQWGVYCTPMLQKPFDCHSVTICCCSNFDSHLYRNHSLSKSCNRNKSEGRTTNYLSWSYFQSGCGLCSRYHPTGRGWELSWKSTDVILDSQTESHLPDHNTDHRQIAKYLAYLAFVTSILKSKLLPQTIPIKTIETIGK